MLKSNEVGRIWLWLSTFDKKKEVKPDVVLPDGFLFEKTEDVTYKHLCGKVVHIHALPNQDLVYGPALILPGGESAQERGTPQQIRKMFFDDMNYLFHAMQHGTIDLENLPKLTNQRIT